MAPLSIKGARDACDICMTKLKRAYSKLERHLPPLPGGESPGIPADRPRERAVSVTTCATCVRELEAMDVGDRAGHVCTHRGEERQDEDLISVGGSEGDRERDQVRTTYRNRKPKLNVIKEYMEHLDVCLDNYTDAVAKLCTVLSKDEEKEDWEEHLLTWSDYCEQTKDRARDLLEMLEAEAATSQGNADAQRASDGLCSTSVIAGPSGSQPLLTHASLAEALSTVQVTSVDNASTSLVTNTDFLLPQPSASSSTGEPLRPPLMSSNLQNPPSIQTTAFMGTGLASQASIPSTGWVIGSTNMYSTTNVELGVHHMNSISSEILEELSIAEQEVASAGDLLSDSTVLDLRQFCDTIEHKIDIKYREAASKLARMDLSRRTNIMQSMENNIRTYKSRLRKILADLRRVRSSITPNPTEVDVRSLSTVTHSARSYKPYIERLKPPTFSGKVQDWPEFRSVWKDLLSDYPESVQVQHLKANVPEADAKRISGVKTMDEIWKRLEKVYGDTKLNIMTVRQNLEGFTPKATDNYKRVLEVFEVVEAAVTQLDNLGALRYIKEDFGLMAKIVAKLPIDDQKRYDEYITSPEVYEDPSSEWDKLWVFLEKLHKLAV